MTEQINFCVSEAPVITRASFPLTLNFSTGKTLITVYPDGNVELSGELKDLNEASMAFWEAVKHCGVGLAAENAELKVRVKDLEDQLCYFTDWRKR